MAGFGGFLGGLGSGISGYEKENQAQYQRYLQAEQLKIERQKAATEAARAGASAARQSLAASAKASQAQAKGNVDAMAMGLPLDPSAFAGGGSLPGAVPMGMVGGGALQGGAGGGIAGNNAGVPIDNYPDAGYSGNWGQIPSYQPYAGQVPQVAHGPMGDGSAPGIDRAPISPVYPSAPQQPAPGQSSVPMQQDAIPGAQAIQGASTPANTGSGPQGMPPAGVAGIVARANMPPPATPAGPEATSPQMGDQSQRGQQQGTGGPSGAADPMSRADSMISNIASNLKKMYPQATPQELAEATAKRIPMIKEIDESDRQAATQRMEQIRMGMEQQRMKQEAIKEANEGWVLKDLPDGSTARINVHTGEVKPLNMKLSNMTGDTSGKPPTAAQIKQGETVGQVRGLLKTANDLQSKLQSMSGMVGIGGTVRRGAETLSGVFGSDQDAREFADQMKDFARDAESMISRSARGMTAQDRKDVESLYSLGPGSNTKKTVNDVELAAQRLADKYGSDLAAKPSAAGGQASGDQPKVIKYDAQGNRVE